jgi:hypothetical protein
VAHHDTSLPCGIWSLSGHSGLWPAERPVDLWVHGLVAPQLPRARAHAPVAASRNQARADLQKDGIIPLTAGQWPEDIFLGEAEHGLPKLQNFTISSSGLLARSVQ